MAGVNGFEKTDNNTFVMHTIYSDWGHRTQLTYDKYDDIIKIELTHIFGYLDFSAATNMSELLRPLVMNSSSKNKQGVFLAGEPEGNRLLLSLRDSHEYFAKWDDEDIAQLLVSKFVSIGASFMLGVPDPIKVFFR